MQPTRVSLSLNTTRTNTNGLKPVQKELDFPAAPTTSGTSPDVSSYIEALRAGCGCIPLFPQEKFPKPVRHSYELNSPTGYISLKDGRRLYKTTIRDSYKSTFLPGRKRDLERLSAFTRELSDIVGEDKGKGRPILESLERKPQAQLEALLAAYLYFIRALSANRSRNGDSIPSMEYYMKVRRSLKRLSTKNYLVDKAELLKMVREVRPEEFLKVRQLLNNGSNRVALALWIAREKAKKSTPVVPHPETF